MEAYTGKGPSDFQAFFNNDTAPNPDLQLSFDNVLNSTPADIPRRRLSEIQKEGEQGDHPTTSRHAAPAGTSVPAAGTSTHGDRYARLAGPRLPPPHPCVVAKVYRTIKVHGQRSAPPLD